MININNAPTLQQLRPKLTRLFDLSGEKIKSLEKTWDPTKGTPVFTVKGRYTSRGWTEWTQGFQFGAYLLQYDVTDEKSFLEAGRRNTVQFMASHVSHIGVHDHGFNNVSTYGNLLRLIREGRTEANEWEKNFCELALKISGAVQAARWTQISPKCRSLIGIDGEKGFIHSFNGRHSLFADTIRSLRALAVAHQLGHVLMGEMDRKISLLERLIQHADTTACYNVFYGDGRDSYDVRGRVAHESIFNTNDGNYRCPNSQQGYSPFTTWTRGLAWIICGYAEQLEFLAKISDKELQPFGGRKKVVGMFEKAALATADFYIEFTPTDGVPYWDTGAPGLAKLCDYLSRPSDPFNEHEPVDSSAAAIAAQGLWRLGKYLGAAKGTQYRNSALTVSNTLFAEPYLSTKSNHHGLLLHSVYHRPNGWDYVPAGAKVPRGESSMWGDYHARELALLLLREATGKPYLTFF